MSNKEKKKFRTVLPDKTVIAGLFVIIGYLCVIPVQHDSGHSVLRQIKRDYGKRLL